MQVKNGGSRASYPHMLCVHWSGGVFLKQLETLRAPQQNSRGGGRGAGAEARMTGHHVAGPARRLTAMRATQGDSRLWGHDRSLSVLILFFFFLNGGGWRLFKKKKKKARDRAGHTRRGDPASHACESTQRHPRPAPRVST